MSSIHAAALEVDLRLPDVHSLKEKRHRLKALGSDIRKTFPVGFAEIGYQDLWQRSTVGIALVVPQHGQLERMIHSIRRYLDNRPEMEVLGIGVAYMEEME